MIKDDKLFVWHPYASAVDKNPLYAVEKAKGVHIHLDSGEKLVDGMSVSYTHLTLPTIYSV